MYGSWKILYKNHGTKKKISIPKHPHVIMMLLKPSCWFNNTMFRDSKLEKNWEKIEESKNMGGHGMNYIFKY